MAKKEDKNEKKTFVFNDENVINSHGFKISTKGISLKRFKKNPVMLDSHNNSNWAVIGNWENVKAENGNLTATPIFDEEDEQANKIKGKVDRGFIKSCSMGVLFFQEDFKLIDGELVLMKCELIEVSIVAIPSNSNSVRLFAEEGADPLTEQELKSLCLSINTIPKNKEKNKNEDRNMKVTLTSATTVALGLSAGTTELESEELNQKIVQLSAEKSALQLQLDSIKDAEETAKLTAINTQVDDAVKAGQISAEKKEDFVNLGIANHALLTSTLASIPVKKSLGVTVINSGGATNVEVKTKEDFQKLSTLQMMQFKAENPEQYKQLFTQKK